MLSCESGILVDVLYGGKDVNFVHREGFCEPLNEHAEYKTNVLLGLILIKQQMNTKSCIYYLINTFRYLFSVKFPAILGFSLDLFENQTHSII